LSLQKILKETQIQIIVISAMDKKIWSWNITPEHVTIFETFHDADVLKLRTALSMILRDWRRGHDPNSLLISRAFPTHFDFLKKAKSVHVNLKKAKYPSLPFAWIFIQGPQRPPGFECDPCRRSLCFIEIEYHRKSAPHSPSKKFGWIWSFHSPYLEPKLGLAQSQAVAVIEDRILLSRAST